MLVSRLDSTPQRQELDVFELNIPGGLVFAFAWVEFRDDAVENITVVVYHQNVFDTNIFLIKKGSLNTSDNLVEILIALETLIAKSDAGHDRLFLFDDHARVGADGSEVEVVLNAEGEPEHQGQQQQQPGSEALYLGVKSHAKTKKTV